MTAPRFADRLSASHEGNFLFAVQAQDALCRPALFFLKVTPERKEMLLERLKTNNGVELPDYGEIVASCYGQSPDMATRQTLEELFGTDTVAALIEQAGR